MLCLSVCVWLCHFAFVGLCVCQCVIGLLFVCVGISLFVYDSLFEWSVCGMCVFIYVCLCVYQRVSVGVLVFMYISVCDMYV